MRRELILGIAAGAAGTTALNTATYLDMACRGRGSSTVPQQVVEELSDRTGVPVPGESDTRANRISGLAPLLGTATGVGVGALYGLARGLGWRPSAPTAAVALCVGAMAGSDGPVAALKLSDPRSWSSSDWASDILPHLAYGSVAAATFCCCTRR